MNQSRPSARFASNWGERSELSAQPELGQTRWLMSSGSRPSSFRMGLGRCLVFPRGFSVNVRSCGRSSAISSNKRPRPMAARNVPHLGIPSWSPPRFTSSVSTSVNRRCACGVIWRDKSRSAGRSGCSLPRTTASGTWASLTVPAVVGCYHPNSHVRWLIWLEPGRHNDCLILSVVRG